MAKSAPVSGKNTIAARNGSDCSIVVTQQPTADGKATEYSFHCSGLRRGKAIELLREELHDRAFPLGHADSFEGNTRILSIQQPLPASKKKVSATFAEDGFLEKEFDRLSDAKAMRAYAEELANVVFDDLHQPSRGEGIADRTHHNIAIRLSKVPVNGTHGEATGYQFTCLGERAADAVEFMRAELNKQDFPLGFSVQHIGEDHMILTLQQPADWMKPRLRTAQGGEIPHEKEFDRLKNPANMQKLAVDLCQHTFEEMKKPGKQQEAIASPVLKRRKLLEVDNPGILYMNAAIEPVKYDGGQEGERCTIGLVGRFADEAAAMLSNELKVRKYPLGSSISVLKDTKAVGDPKCYTVQFPLPQRWMLDGLEKQSGKPDPVLFHKLESMDGFCDLVRDVVGAVSSEYMPMGTGAGSAADLPTNKRRNYKESPKGVPAAATPSRL